MADLQIFIDGDACPVKDEIYRVAVRHGVPAVLVSNSYIRMPEHAARGRTGAVHEGGQVALPFGAR